MKALNLFYEEPDRDRWFPFDRFPRKVIRRIIRGKSRPGGVMMIALGLMKGLDRIQVPYRFNDFKYADKHPEELACIIGKPQLLYDRKWKNPVLFGAGVFSHPIDCPDLFERYPNVQRILVPGEWMRQMCKPWYGDKVLSWPVGIDTDEWNPAIKQLPAKTDFLIYDKVRWEHDRYQQELIDPVIASLNKRKLSYTIIRYGAYSPAELREKLAICRSAIFLCEHETQGIAYQQMLATGTPVLAWDRRGFWQDPDYFPAKVKYEPVSSVPYWDLRCGKTFADAGDFDSRLDAFLKALEEGAFDPAAYILASLTLEISARKYLDIVEQLTGRVEGARNSDAL